MDLRFFAQSLAEICAHALAAPGRPLVWTIIANPRAGGFTIGSRWKAHYRILKDYVARARPKAVREDARPSRTAREMAPGRLGMQGLVPTAAPGHAMAIARAFIDEAEEGRAFYLIITAGGDGTSLEALSALYSAPPETRSNFAVLRLPMGTGNDGSAAWELAGGQDLLTKPSRIEYQRAVRLRTAPGGALSGRELLAFNILSVGLDAFVTHMTNKMKGNLPGDSYKLWVDIAALLYDRIYKVGPLNVRAFDETGALARSFTEKALLLAVGAGGRRTYGSHKRILPDDRNVCMVKQMPLLRKLALKGLFTTGKHADRPEALLFSAARIEISGEHPILAQMDGETALLEPADFPAVMELTEPVIPALKLVYA
jgi:diacylglycerol kinase family enzyme